MYVMRLRCGARNRYADMALAGELPAFFLNARNRVRLRTPWCLENQQTACWGSPALPDTFGKLTILSEVSNAEKTIYGGVQG